DVLVIGGGITGAAVARDAAARGLTVALVEKGDWASGTSWRSSKLIHGGLRYLKTGNVRLVFESLSERARLSRLAPHLVRPTDFLFPAYRGRGVAPWQLEVGLTLYDLLALGRSLRRHRRLSREETLRRERMLESPELAAAGLYGDGRTDDARLTLENVLDAALLGAVPVSRAAVDALEKDGHGRARGARARDLESGRELVIRARSVVNATGPWGDTLRKWDDPSAHSVLRLSRGAHLTVPAARLPLGEAIAFPMDDGRLLFAIPYGSVTLLGTTDTDHRGAADDVRAAPEDVAYILAAARRTFPTAGISDADVVATFASLRPLVGQPGVSVGETSREDAIEVAPSGLVTVTGGKLTTHVRMGRKAVDAAAKPLAESGVSTGRSRTSDRPFPGAPDQPMPEFVELLLGAREPADPSLSDDTISHLAYRYGRRAWEVFRLTVEDRSLGRPIVEGLPDIDAEIVFAARFEDTRSLIDALARRTHLFWQAPGQGMEALERAADLLGKELGWTPDQRRGACDDYAREVARSREWKQRS
ncbi:MAG TPA: glycerol-3-phosphate dehydrogenase/oxidase, partial [Thermoanaerobaculia bacterium]|nr:glycerol-3-phosphate dehydrogenase/oxidase [Thermoanaerobaculia bacterium]